MTKDADGKITFDTEINTKTFDEQISYLEEKINDLINDYNTMAEKKGFNEQSNQAMQLRKNIEQVSNQIISLRKQQTKLEETSNKSWKKMANSLKKFALRMVGIASVYGIVSKASSTYLNENEEVANKLKSIWSLLGDVLGPVINGVADLILKGVGYLNEFIKALTGVDKIAEHNAKALQKQAKAQKQLNIETYDFDVIRKQSGALKTSSYNGIIDIPELDQGIINKLKKLAAVLKDNKDLIKDVGIVLGVTFGAVAIAKILSGISTLMGSSQLLTGLNGLATILAIIGTVWVATIAVKGLAEALKQAKELKALRDDLEDRAQKQSKKNIEETTKIVEDYLSGNKNMTYDEMVSFLNNMIEVSERAIEGASADFALIQQREIEAYNKLLKRVYKDVGVPDYVINAQTQPESTIAGTTNYAKTIADLEYSRHVPFTNYADNYSNAVNVYLDGRLIQRQISGVQNNINFATNK